MNTHDIDIELVLDVLADLLEEAEWLQRDLNIERAKNGLAPIEEGNPSSMPDVCWRQPRRATSEALQQAAERSRALYEES